jgi:hypothetical protein
LIYICIPAHNEEQTVGVVLWKIRQVMAEFPRDYQILVADDASTDKTSEVLSPYARVLPLTVVRSEQRRGYAASLEMLLREAARRSEYPKRDMIITIQADFSQEPEDLVPMIKKMEAGADIVCGEHTLPPETAWKIRWSRSISAKLLGRKSVPQGIKDPFTGYRAYRVFTVKKAIEDRAGGRLLQHDSWAANAELLALTAAHARRVEALDVTVRPHRLQRPSRLHPWPAVKNVWAYARRARPEIEAASVEELDDVVASGATSRRNDVESVRERMSERSDMHGNRSPHGDRQPHNARPERARYERGSRDRNASRAQGSERPRNDRAQSSRPDRTTNPRGERKPNEPRRQPEPRAQNDGRAQNEPRPNRDGQKRTRGEPRTRQNGDRARAAREDATPVVDAVAPDALITADGATDTDAAVQPAAEPARRRRWRGRRSRGGANRNGGNGDAVAGSEAQDGTIADVVHNNELSGDVDADADGDDTAGAGNAAAANGDGAPARKRRRGRRGGRGRRRQNTNAEGDTTRGEEAATFAETEQNAPEVVREQHENDA